MASTIRYSTFPLTEHPPDFADSIVDAFKLHEPQIATEVREGHLTSDTVLAILAPELISLGFDVELGKKRANKIIDLCASKVTFEVGTA